MESALTNHSQALQRFDWTPEGFENVLFGDTSTRCFGSGESDGSQSEQNLQCMRRRVRESVGISVNLGEW